MHGITLTSGPSDWEIIQQEKGKATVNWQELIRYTQRPLKWALPPPRR